MLTDDDCYWAIALWAFPPPTLAAEAVPVPLEEPGWVTARPDPVEPEPAERETVHMTTLDALKAALYTALWTFIGTWGITLLGWLQDLTEWATSEGATAFPALSALGYAAVSAIIAAFSGVVAFAVRFTQSKGVFGAKAAVNGPTYTTTMTNGG